MPQASAAKNPSWLDSLISEPLTHFTVIAVFLFGGFSLMSRNDKDAIEISQREINARVFLAEMSAGEAISSAQTEAIKQQYIQQQVLVREAKLRGLDNDSRIHNILDQKLRHVLSGDVIQPSKDELIKFFDQHRDRYRSPDLVTIDEIVFNSVGDLDKPTQTALQQGSPSSEILTLETGSAAPLSAVSKEDLSNIFTTELAAEVFSKPDNSWSGPYFSNRGQHWLQVLERLPASEPTLEEISDLVRLDWIALEEDKLLQTKITEILSQYSIEIVDDTSNATE